MHDSHNYAWLLCLTLACRIKIAVYLHLVEPKGVFSVHILCNSANGPPGGHHPWSQKALKCVHVMQAITLLHRKHVHVM